MSDLTLSSSNLSTQPLRLPPRTELFGQQATLISLNLSDVRKLLPAMEKFFITHSVEEIGLSRRFEQQLEDGKNYFMPAIIGEYEALKVIHSRPANSPRGIERSQSTIVVSDRRSGLHLFTISGTEVTPVKTAITTMVALKNWIEATNPKLLNVGIFGGGGVSRAHIASIYQLFGERVGLVRAFSTGQSAARMVSEISSRYPCELSTKDMILNSSNVIISSTTTLGSDPVVLLEEFPKNNNPMFVAGIGFNDIAAEFFAHARIIISEDPLSYLKSELILAKRIREAHGQVLYGLSDIIAGKVAVPKEGVMLFMPYGTALTDLTVCLESLGINPATSAVQF